MNGEKTKTLRLLMPQWQGGDYDFAPSSGETYPLGARLLAFLAPESDAPLVEVPVEPYRAAPRTKQNGVIWQDAILHQLRAAHRIIAEHNPDRIVTFGGECHVSQAPFAYLNEKYGGGVGLIWLDSHPDVTTPEHRDREHAMVLGNLLGKGDPVLAREVPVPYKPEHVLLVGVDGYDQPYEEETVKELGLRVVTPQEVAADGEVVLRWIKDNGLSRVVIHFDLDVMSPATFYSQFSMNPEGLSFATRPGGIPLARISDLIMAISGAADAVGLTFAEHMPWDAYYLRKMLREFPIMK